MEFYERMQGVATRLLTKFGKPSNLVLIRDTSGVFDPVEGEVAGSALNRISLVGVVLEYKEKDIDGTKIKRQDRMVLIDSAIRVTKNDKIEVAGAVMSVIENKPLSPAGLVVISKVQVRA